MYIASDSRSLERRENLQFIYLFGDLHFTRSILKLVIATYIVHCTSLRTNCLHEIQADHALTSALIMQGQYVLDITTINTHLNLAITTIKEKERR